MPYPSKRKLQAVQASGHASQERIKRSKEPDNVLAEIKTKMNANISNSTPSASKLKIESLQKNKENSETSEQKWTLLHVHTLTDLMSELSCAECGESGSLYVCVLEGKQMGYSTKLSLKCKHCEYSKEGYSSPRCNYSNEPSTPFEINRRMALFSHEIGGSHASLKKFSAVVGMPVMTLSTYQNHDKNLVGECYV